MANKGLSIKRVCSQGDCLLRTFCGQWGSSNSNVRTFWCKTNRIFQNLWCARTDKGGGRFESVRIFFGQGEGGQFFRFCADVLYGFCADVLIIFWLILSTRKNLHKSIHLFLKQLTVQYNFSLVQQASEMGTAYSWHPKVWVLSKQHEDLNL